MKKTSFGLALLGLIACATAFAGTPPNEVLLPGQPTQTCVYTAFGVCLVKAPAAPEPASEEGCVPTICKCRCPKTTPAL